MKLYATKAMYDGIIHMYFFMKDISECTFLATNFSTHGRSVGDFVSVTVSFQIIALRRLGVTFNGGFCWCFLFVFVVVVGVLSPGNRE